MDKAFKNVNEAQGVGLILQAGALQHAKMRLAQGPLGAGRVHLLGILLAEGLSEDRTKPRSPKDISHPSTVLLGRNRPGRCQMGGEGEPKRDVVLSQISISFTEHHC